jgi:hypothetical protein
MDVRQDEMVEILDSDSTVAERGLERVEARGRSAVDERRLVARPEVRSDDLRMPEVQKVERLAVAI